MRRTIINATVVVLIMAALFTIAVTGGHYESVYKIEGAVIKVENMTTTIVDTRGHIWTYYTNDFTPNQKVEITLTDNHTTRIRDDEVLNIEPI